MATLPDLPTPAQFNALRVTSSDPACTVLQNYVKMIQLVADLVGNIYNPDGSFTQAFIDKICATGCAGGGSGSSTTGASSNVSLYMASRFLDAGVYRGRFFYIDTSTFTFSTINGSMNEVITGIAVRPSDGVVFVLYYNWTLGVHPLDLWLGTISTSTGVITPIAVVIAGAQLLPNPQYSLAFRSDGVLFMDGHEGPSQLYTVNTTTGVPTALGDHYRLVSSPTSMVQIMGVSFDSFGVLWGIGGDGASGVGLNLYTINTTPDPSISNALMATFVCNFVGASVFNAFTMKNAKKYAFYTTVGDLYQIADGNTCGLVSKIVAPASMADVTAAGGVTS